MTIPDGSPDPAARIARGLALLGAGKPAEAAALAAAALDDDPRDADALHLAGAAAHATGDARRALALVDQAIALAPMNARFHFNRAGILAALGDRAAAVEAYGRAAALSPGYAQAHVRQGQTLLRMGRAAGALAALDRAVALGAGSAEIEFDRGTAMTALGRDDDAIAAYGRAIAARPDFAPAHFAHANACVRLGRDAQALDGYRRCATLAPANARPLAQAACMLFRLGRFAEALEAFDTGLALDPRDAVALANRGATLLALGRPAEALDSCDRALAIDPNSGDAHFQRGNALSASRRFDAAAIAYRRAHAAGYRGPHLSLALGHACRALGRWDEARTAFRDAADSPDAAASAWFNLGNVARDTNDFAAAAKCYDRAYDANPDIDHLVGTRIFNAMTIADWRPLQDHLAKHGDDAFADGRGFSPFSLLALTDDPELQREGARNWARKWPRTHADIPDPPPADKIRIAYVSSDFRAHAVAFLLAGTLEAHDRSRFRVVGLSIGGRRDDDMRRRICAACDEFVDCTAMGDDEVAALARAKGIDVAIDLNGYTTTNRPGIFAARSAPVQISFLGFPGTTALSGMDYLIADRVVVPVGAERHYTEKIIRLPHSYQANDRARAAGARVWTRPELGLPEHGFVFCCFNNSFKILPDVFASWMRILAGVPASVLWLLQDNETAAENLRGAAGAAGIDPARIVFAKRAALDDHIARHRQADLFLDTLPYNAHTTASDALWAGLPVLTLIGRSFAGRVASSLLHAVGVPELVVDSVAAYEAKAIALAHDPASLAALRTRLVANRMTAPLFDTLRFTRNIESAYAAVHARRLAGLAPDHVEIRDRTEQA